MLKSLKNTVVIILATLGVLFIILMLMPDDEETTEEAETVAVQETTESATLESTVALEEISDEATATSDSAPSNAANSVPVTIPDSEKSKNVLKFSTVSLDNKIVNQDIFSDYDITIVHVWGTFCRPCIAEMGDYASFYKNHPANVNLVGLMCDVYDGIESNVSDAESILGDVDADFLNLRTSDDLYDLISYIGTVPTSFFVDREGHIIGEIFIGANYKTTMEKLEEYLK